MKKYIIISCILIFFGCKTKNVNGKLIGKSVTTTELNAEQEVQKNKAYELGKRLLMTCNTSKFKAFNKSEATDKVIANSTEKKVKEIGAKYSLKYGAFKDLEFTEMIPNKTDKTNIYRFKALFNYAKANKELRVTMNSENKISAITTKDWKDNFQ
ncbi:hypothetical protein [Flavobacterium sp. WC2509]|uniref:hypothetical protein n=1 Tax=Flavobacterium sp. WC2509 TaxID=3461406 RepID=UPI0040443E84